MGAALANLAVYPLDLVVTRLQLQRHSEKQKVTAHEQEELQRIRETVLKIYNDEGGLTGFYGGIREDTVKTIADGFLFFLGYTYLRKQRLRGRSSSDGLRAWEELGVGFVAGAVSKFCTTPIANVVTRKQAATSTLSTRDLVDQIRREKGVRGFWSGYSASLVLTLNPSLTFFLFETYKKLLLPKSRRQNPSPAATFLLSAMSKACASAVTYPFSLAKARAQAGSKQDDESEEKVADQDSQHSAAEREAAKSTIFGNVLAIAQTEGVGALYDGLELELVKGFFSHGLTMLAKQAIHRFILQMYYVLAALVKRYQGPGANPISLAERAKARGVEYYDLAMARAGEKVDEVRSQVLARAYETAEFVGEYVEEEGEEWKDLYGEVGLARWLDTGRIKD